MNDFLRENIRQMRDDCRDFHIVRKTEGDFAVLYLLRFVEDDLLGFDGFLGTFTSCCLGKVAEGVCILNLLEFILGCGKTWHAFFKLIY
jgi:hypothetical protein